MSMSVKSDPFEPEHAPTARWSPAARSARVGRVTSPPVQTTVRTRRASRLGGRIRVAVLAWWRACELDRRLAAGEDPGTSALLTARARRITGRRSRERLAAGLERALHTARSVKPVFTAVVRPNASEALDARTVLTTLQRRLRASEPVAAQGVAMLMVLLTDGTSALYQRHEAGTLGSQLRAAAAALEPTDRQPPPAVQTAAGTPVETRL